MTNNQTNPPKIATMPHYKLHHLHIVPRLKFLKKSIATKSTLAMAKRSAILILLSALCFLSLIGTAVAAESHFFVEGQVYCDTCRAQFVTRLTKNIPDAEVRLECKNRTTNELTFSEEATTDKSGTYRIPVDGDHEDDICEIIPVKSSDPDCSEISKSGFAKEAARISLTSNNGIITPTRQANPLGFMPKQRLSQCGEVFKELGILPEDLMI